MSLRTIIAIGVIACATNNVAAQSVRDRQFVVSANVGVQAQSTSRTDVANFDLNREVGEVRATQTLGPYLLLDAGGSIRLWKGLGIGLAVSHTQGSAAAAIEADVPHPFFFEFDRAVVGSRTGLRHREVAYHFLGQFHIPLSSTTLVTVSGGPTYFDASQELVAEVRTSERGFPFEEIDLVSTEVERVSATAWGYNVGLDLAYWGSRLNIFQRLGLPDRVGVGVGVRYSWAKPDLDLRGLRQERALQVGVAHVVGGVRVGF